MPRERRAWVAALARVGFAVKGLLYLMLGALALQFALGNGGRLTDPSGAIAGLFTTPYGHPLVIAVASGLALYAAWRFLEAFADANNKGTDASAIASRAVYALSGVVYSVLAIDAGILAYAGRRGATNTDLPTTITGSELARWMVLLVAAVLVGYGLMQLRRSASRRLSDQLSHARVQRHVGHWPVRISRIGIAGRGIVLLLMGVVLGQRAVTSVDAAARTGTADSLRLIAALPTGDWLLAGVAAGLMAYGVFQLVQARYRSITPP